MSRRRSTAELIEQEGRGQHFPQPRHQCHGSAEAAALVIRETLVRSVGLEPTWPNYGIVIHRI